MIMPTQLGQNLCQASTWVRHSEETAVLFRTVLTILILLLFCAVQITPTKFREIFESHLKPNERKSICRIENRDNRLLQPCNTTLDT